MHTFYTSCPVSSRTREVFVEHINVGGEKRRIEFEKEIVWLVESESALLFVHGGNEIKEGSTYNDFYGFLSSIGYCIKSAENEAESFSVSKDSSLSIVVRTRILKRPCFETDVCKKHNTTKAETMRSMFADVPDNWRKEMVDTISGHGDLYYPSLKPEQLLEAITYSTALSDGDNAALAFIDAMKDLSLLIPQDNDFMKNHEKCTIIADLPVSVDIG